MTDWGAYDITRENFGAMSNDVEGLYIPSFVLPTQFIPHNAKFMVKDSGQRIDYPSGMRRDVDDLKPKYTLLPREFLTRWAMHMTKAIAKYGRDNWRLANSPEELERFKDSAMRHMIQWLDGDVSEDHAVSCCFNIAAAEMVKTKLAAK